MKKTSLLLIIAICGCFCGKQPQDTMYADDDDYSIKQARSTKRGISFNVLYEADFAAIEKGIGWAYNWGASGFNTTLENAANKSKISYFPMFWNGDDDWISLIRKYKEKHLDCEYILAFNEPNLVDQARMTPAEAAKKWTSVKKLAQDLNMKIVAPAMNYGTLEGYSDPIVWYDEFFSQPGVSINDVSALALHCYMNAPSAVKSFMERFRKYGKPIWLTEFCAWEGSRTAEQQRSYMSQILNYLESEPMIERYAWFKYDGSTTANPCYGLRPTVNKEGELSDLGKIYVAMSSYDKKYYYGHNQVIPAEHYCNTNMSTVAHNKWENSVDLKVCSDSTGILEITLFGKPKWLEYKINPSESGKYNLIIRYASSIDSKFSIICDNKEVGEIELPKTGGNTSWTTITIPAALPISIGGKQTVRFVPIEGAISMNWWRYKKEGA